jgi:hydrogenase-4 component B
MRTGMAILAVACVALGLGATWFLPVFAPVTQNLLGIDATKALLAGHGLVLTAGAVHSGSVSTAAIGLLLAELGAVPLLFWYVVGRKYAPKLVSGSTWDCGLPGLTAENEYTATAFSKPLRMIFAALFRPHREIQAEYEVSPYYPKAIHFESEIESTFEERIYRPLSQGILWAASKMRWLQSGSIHLYLAYVFVTLILLLLFGARG